MSFVVEMTIWIERDSLSNMILPKYVTEVVKFSFV